MAEVDPLGDSGEESVHASLDPPLFCLVELTGLLAYRVPYSRPARTMPSGTEKPARRWLAAARCAVPQVHVVCVPAAPAPPGSHRTRGQCDPARRRSDARPPEMAQESTHRLFTGILRARGYGASRPVVASGRRFVVCGAAWGGAPPTRVPPGAEHRSIAFLLPPYRSYTRPTTCPVSQFVIPSRGGGLVGVGGGVAEGRLAAAPPAVRSSAARRLPPPRSPPPPSSPRCPRRPCRGGLAAAWPTRRWRRGAAARRRGWPLPLGLCVPRGLGRPRG